MVHVVQVGLTTQKSVHVLAPAPCTRIQIIFQLRTAMLVQFALSENYAETAKDKKYTIFPALWQRWRSFANPGSGARPAKSDPCRQLVVARLLPVVTISQGSPAGPTAGATEAALPGQP